MSKKNASTEWTRFLLTGPHLLCRALAGAQRLRGLAIGKKLRYESLSFRHALDLDRNCIDRGFLPLETLCRLGEHRGRSHPVGALPETPRKTGSQGEKDEDDREHGECHNLFWCEAGEDRSVGCASDQPRGGA